MTRRRVVAAVVAGVLALGGLVACDLDRTTAASVGDTQYTLAEVDEMFEELLEKQPETTVTRQLIVETLVVGELARSLAIEQGVELYEVTVDDIAVAENVPTSTRYAQVRADMATHLRSWSGQVEVVQPTEPQLRELHQVAIEAGEEWAELPFEELGHIFDDRQVAQAIVVRDALAAEAERVGVTVHQRYVPLRYPFLHFSGGAPAVFLSIGQTNDVVYEDG